MRAWPSCVLTVIGTLALGAPAGAVTVQRDGTAMLVADPTGADDDVTLNNDFQGWNGNTSGGGLIVRVIDPDGAHAVGEGCQQVDEQTVLCQAEVYKLQLGGGADRIRLEVRTSGFVDAGAGDDVVTVGVAPRDYYSRVVIAGGEGNDAVTGGGEEDVVDGGPGSDFVDDGGGFLDRISGGDGDDRLVHTGGSGGSFGDQVVLDGGAGSDELSNPEGGAGLFGGDGADTLRGGTGTSNLDGGRGADQIFGGAGTDRLSYAGQAEPVYVDLASPDRAEAGQDRIYGSIEEVELSPGADVFRAGSTPVRVIGGGGDDRIVGSGAGDLIDAGLGRNVVDAGGGDDSVFANGTGDVVDGGPGRDTLTANGDGGELRGGPGNDVLTVTHGAGLTSTPVIDLTRRWQLLCGSGFDLARGSFRDGVGLDCERSDDGTATAWRNARPDRRGQVVFKVRCGWESSLPCRGKAELRGWWPSRVPADLRSHSNAGVANATPPEACVRTRVRVLGSGRFVIKAGRVNRATLTVTKSGRRLLRRKRCVATTARFLFATRSGAVRETTRTVALRRK